MTIVLYAVGVVVFIGALYVSIALHELGHLVLAKRYGCRVAEYMIGFGPKLASFTRGETSYGVRLIPFGGYVSIIGMFPPKADEPVMVDPDTGEPVVRLRRSNTGLFAQIVSETRSSARKMVTEADSDRLFYKLPWYRKAAVMAAGPAVNIVLAFICLCAVFGIHGVYSVEPTGSTVVTSIAECMIDPSEARTTCQEGDQVSPAAAAGLRPGDEITGMNGIEVLDWFQLTEMIHANGTAPIELEVLRDGRRIDLEPTNTIEVVRDVSDDASGEMATVGYLGAEPVSEQIVTRGGPIYTLGEMADMAVHSAKAIVTLPQRVANVALAIVGLGEREADGPMSLIGGSRLAGEVASADEATTGLLAGDKVALLTMVIGSFNLFLGMLNLIPLLPLDGGHIAGSLWEGLRRGVARLFGRPDPGFVDVARQMPIAYIFGIYLFVMGTVLMIGDVVVPLSTGL